MAHLPSRRVGASALIAAALLAGGCKTIPDHKGYIADAVLVDSVRAGVDNRDSVMKTLGRPSLESEFDGGASWYYVSRDTRQLAFANPRPTAQTLLAVRFDRGGNVVDVERSGLEQVVKISPAGGKTPTLGRDRGFFKELFGNIGAVGAGGQSGGTADNPNSGP